MKKDMQREGINSKILVKGVYYDEKEFISRQFPNTDIDGIIRISESEYCFIDMKKKYLDHFNLQICGHEVGKIYSLPRILKHGYFTEEKEQLPDLLFDKTILGKCVLVKQNLSFNELGNFDFNYSFQHIKSINALKTAILKRYKQSMPKLSDDDILKLGVSLTRLEIIK